VPRMAIGQLAARSGLSVRTLRFYADSGVLPAARSESGYRQFDSDAVARARLVRTLRELGVGLNDVKHVLAAEAALADVAAAHAAHSKRRSARCGCSAPCSAPSQSPPNRRSWCA
jgi:DNA-binding transcriptional MerR regulator